MGDVDIEQTFEVEVLEKEAIKDRNVEGRLPMFEDDVVVIINQMGKMGHQQQERYHQHLKKEILQ